MTFDDDFFGPVGAQLWPLRRRSRQIPLCLRVQTKLDLIPMNTPTLFFFEKKWILRYFLRFPVTSENPPTDVAVTHILISDRNIFSKQKYVSISFRSGAHVGERNLFLSAIRRSYRRPKLACLTTSAKMRLLLKVFVLIPLYIYQIFI